VLQLSGFEGIAYELDVLRRLVEIDTDVMKKTGYSKCAAAIKELMEEANLKVDVFDPAKATEDQAPRPNVVGTLDVGAKETVALITHYDVVPPGEGWKKDPFKLIIEGDRAYGRGAADDKSSIAVCLGAIKRVAREAKYNVKLIASPDEEVGGDLGIGYLMRNLKMRFDFGVIVDAAPNFICIGASGIVWGKIKVVGKQGHAGYGHLADNPIPKLAKLIGQMEEFTRYREAKRSVVSSPPNSPKDRVWGRISYTIIGGGEKENIIPSTAWASFDMRLLPEEKPADASAEMVQFFNKAKESLGIEAEISFHKRDPGFLTRPDERHVKEIQEATSKVFGSPLPLGASLGGDDGKFLAEQGIPVVSYGAIADDTHFHGSDEFVYLKDLRAVRDVFVNLLR